MRQHTACKHAWVVTPDTDEALSLKDYLAQQFEQPIFVLGVGDTAYAVKLHAPDGNLATQVKGVEGFVFRDASTGATHSPEDRFRLLCEQSDWGRTDVCSWPSEEI